MRRPGDNRGTSSHTQIFIGFIIPLHMLRGSLRQRRRPRREAERSRLPPPQTAHRRHALFIVVHRGARRQTRRGDNQSLAELPWLPALRGCSTSLASRDERPAQRSGAGSQGPRTRPDLPLWGSSQARFGAPGSKANRSGWRNQSASYSKLAPSRPREPTARDAPPDAQFRAGLHTRMPSGESLPTSRGRVETSGSPHPLGKTLPPRARARRCRPRLPLLPPACLSARERTDGSSSAIPSATAGYPRSTQWSVCRVIPARLATTTIGSRRRGRASRDVAARGAELPAEPAMEEWGILLA